METNQRELKKETEVLGGYDRTQYTSERIMATAKRRYPDSHIYRLQAGMEKWAKTPCCSMVMARTAQVTRRSHQPDSRSNQIMAHIRGGGEMGRKWYEDGKLAQK